MRRGRLFRRRTGIDRFQERSLDELGDTMEAAWQRVRGSGRRGMIRGQEALADLRETIRLHPGVTLAVGGTAIGLLLWIALRRGAQWHERYERHERHERHPSRW